MMEAIHNQTIRALAPGRVTTDGPRFERYGRRLFRLYRPFVIPSRKTRPSTPKTYIFIYLFTFLSIYIHF